MIDTKTIANNFELTGSFEADTAGNMLAPRGVCVAGTMMAISDTGQNRVLIVRDFENVEKRTVIQLGHIARNNQQVSAGSLYYPSGIWTDGKKLIVADAWNHRVLIWHSVPTKDQQLPDIVVGQTDFSTCQPNVYGVGKPCTASSLYWPYGVWSDGSRLWIADTGNRRILFYRSIPEKNFAAADAVIGQAAFDERDMDNENAVWPYALKISAAGELLISDTQYFRVLFWSNWEQAFTKKAEQIFGQPDLYANGQNQYQLTPQRFTLNWCYDACFFQKGVAIADTGNSRIVIHEKIPTHSNPPAVALIGQPNFTTNGESSLSMKSTRENELYWPFAVHSFEDRIVIADTGNHRILIYKKRSQ